MPRAFSSPAIALRRATTQRSSLMLPKHLRDVDLAGVEIRLAYLFVACPEGRIHL